MKSSERINEIYKKILKKENVNAESSESILVYLRSLATYLDEEWEKRQDKNLDAINALVRSSENKNTDYEGMRAVGDK